MITGTTEPSASESRVIWSVSNVDLIVPVYRNRPLLERCIQSISANKAEISANLPRIVVINDSPDDLEVTEYLRDEDARGVIDVLIENRFNVGFIKSVNKALDETRKRGASAILINSDTETFVGTLAELIAVADTDNQFGFVCPRSNNASICTFPKPPHARAGGSFTPQATFDIWNELKDLLPRYTYAPTAIGFYMLIKSVIIQNFAGLDERFGVGYEEENDLVLRGGKVGFRAVIANHAFAYHAGSASFKLTDIELHEHKLGNLSKIDKIHPEYLPDVRRFENSAEYRAQLLLKGMLKDSAGAIDIAFVLLNVGQSHNGTNEFIVSVLKEFGGACGSRYNITILCHAATAEFHNLDDLVGVRVTDAIDHVYAVAFCFGQPYDVHIVNVMETIAPITVYSMLDVISLDCGPLRYSQDIEELWRYVAETSNGLVFISQFSKETFFGRFANTRAKSHARLLSTQTGCYIDRYKGRNSGARHIFVAGNHFAHKDSGRVGKILANSFPSLGFLVFGEKAVYPPNVTLLQSGSIGDEDMVQAICNSSAIVLPSFYEGFGFTLMHALAAGKPIVARDIPATREILEKFEGLAGVYLFSNDNELIAALGSCLSVSNSSFSRELGDSWRIWTERLVGFLDELILDRESIYSNVVRRIRRGDALRASANHSSGKTPAGLLPGSIAVNEASVLSWGELAELPAEEFVDCIYENILGRGADTEGRIHHTKLVENGGDRAEIVRAFLTNEEFRNSKRNVRVLDLPQFEIAPAIQNSKKPFWGYFRSNLRAK